MIYGQRPGGDRNGALKVRGLTMVETIVAATVLSLILMSVLTLLPGAMALVERNKQTNVATYLAHDLLEGQAARPFPTLTLGTETLPDTLVPAPYKATATISAVDGYTVERLKSIKVRVEWPYKDRTLLVEQELYVHAVRR